MRATLKTQNIVGRGRRFALALAFIGGFAHAQTELQNRDRIRQALGLESYDSMAGNLANVKIAILDNAFGDFDSTTNGGRLPPTAQRIKAPTGMADQDRHGLEMAQVVWGITGHLQEGPEMYLINTNGFSNLKWAIDYIIQNKIDIVLYSQSWAFGGNFDGKGFINAAVTRATDAGVLWINTAGNDGQMVYNGKVEIDESTGYVKLPGPEDTLRLKNNVDENPVAITLSWSDFSDDENYKTSKDLDLHIYDSQGNLIKSAAKVQKSEDPAPGDVSDKRSAHAREELFVTLNRGDYTLRVERKSYNFSSSDKIRVTIHPQRIGTMELKDRSNEGEVNMPADHAEVVTVGACNKESAIGPTADGRSKPDIAIMESVTQLTNGVSAEGSSNAAAMITGVAALMKAAHPGLTAAGFKRYVKELQARPVAGVCIKAPFWRTPKPGDLPLYN